jgi:diacylglycerol O-acyltransferase / wax synthase
MPPGPPADRPVPLTPLDVFHAELGRRRQADTNLHIGVFLRVGGPAVPLPRLRQLVAEGVRRAPVLAYRLSGCRRRWEPVPGFDPAPHIDERLLPRGGDPLAAAVNAVRAPLPRECPLWGLTVLRGYAEGEYTLCYRTHHMFQDGMAMNATLEALFADRRLAEPGGRPGRGRRPRPPTGTWTGGWVWPLPRTAGWAPFGRPVTGHPVLHTAVLDVAELEAVARNAGLTVYQVCLAALAGAVRAWRPQAFGASAPSRNRNGLHASFPVSLRASDDDALGNGSAAMPVILPCGEPSPAGLLRQTAAQTDPRRVERYRRVLRTVTRYFPYWLLVRTDVGLRPLVVSAMRLTGALTVLGAPVAGATAYPGHPFDVPLAIMMQRYGREITASILTDEVVTDPERLGELWQQAVTTLNHHTTGRRP